MNPIIINELKVEQEEEVKTRRICELDCYDSGSHDGSDDDGGCGSCCCCCMAGEDAVI